MVIEGATDEADAAGLRGRDVSVRRMCRHTQKETVSIFFIKSFVPWLTFLFHAIASIP